jgi:hypothetical protein
MLNPLRYTITFETYNDAFFSDGELDYVLMQIAQGKQALKDINGNTIGKVTIEHLDGED